MERYKDLERIFDLKQELNKYLDILFLYKSRGKPLIKSSGDSPRWERLLIHQITEPRIRKTLKGKKFKEYEINGKKCEVFALKPEKNFCGNCYLMRKKFLYG